MLTLKRPFQGKHLAGDPVALSLSCFPLFSPSSAIVQELHDPQSTNLHPGLSLPKSSSFPAAGTSSGGTQFITALVPPDPHVFTI